LKALLDRLSPEADSSLYAYIYVSVYVGDSWDDDVLSWEGGPDTLEGPPPSTLAPFLSELRVLLKYSEEMMGE